MSFSHYPLSDRIDEEGVVKNMFSFFNIIHLSKFRLVDTTWSAFVKNNFFNFNAALMQKLEKVKQYMHREQPYSSHFNLYYNKNGGFILDILKSTVGIHQDGHTNGLIGALKDELPFLKRCNQELDFFSDRMYFWSSDGIAFYQMQQEDGSPKSVSRVTVGFRTDEHDSTFASCCKIQFSAMRSFGRREDFAGAKALLLDSSSQPILEFERCPDHQVDLFLYFIMQNKIRMIPLKNRKDPVCLVPFGNYNDVLLITRQKNNGSYFLNIRENNVWRDQPRCYSITFDDNSLLRITFENNYGCKAIIVTLNKDNVVTQCEVELMDDSRIPLTLMELSEEMLAEMSFLLRGVNPRITPLDLFKEDQNQSYIRPHY